MNVKKILQIALMGCCVLSVIGCTHTMRVRPVKLKVVDAETQEPLKGVKVYYVLRSHVYKKRIFLIIPNPEPVTRKDTEIEEIKYTDERGVVYFEEKNLILGRNQYISNEGIYINLDLTDEAKRRIDKKNDRVGYFMHYVDSAMSLQNFERIINPDNNYKGFYLYSTSYYFDIGAFPPPTQEMFNCKWNPEGLLKPAEEFIIELERYKK